MGPVDARGLRQLRKHSYVHRRPTSGLKFLTAGRSSMKLPSLKSPRGAVDAAQLFCRTSCITTAPVPPPSPPRRRRRRLQLRLQHSSLYPCRQVLQRQSRRRAVLRFNRPQPMRPSVMSLPRRPLAAVRNQPRRPEVLEASLRHPSASQGSGRAATCRSPRRHRLRPRRQPQLWHRKRLRQPRRLLR